MARYSIDLPIILTDAQEAAIRGRHGLGPDDDLAPYVMLYAQEVLLRAMPGATVAVEEVPEE
ncbi:hypothetical protein ACFXKD_27950 [Nocardiopsis aegyptia]|uniref:hypothetical protein n=1 Tax=Nocardiopsis aegyptia TaxID=220378 RepID=UPI00366A80C0